MCLMRISSWRQDQGSGHRNSHSPRLKNPRPSSITQLFRLRRMQIEIDRIIMKSSSRRVQGRDRERGRKKEREGGREEEREGDESAHKCQNLWRCLLCLLLDKSGIENRFLVLFLLFLLLLLLLLISCFWPKRTALARHGMGNWPAVNCRPLMTSSLCV